MIGPSHARAGGGAPAARSAQARAKKGSITSLLGGIWGQIVEKERYFVAGAGVAKPCPAQYSCITCVRVLPSAESVVKRALLLGASLPHSV